MELLLDGGYSLIPLRLAAWLVLDEVSRVQSSGRHSRHIVVSVVPPCPYSYDSHGVQDRLHPEEGWFNEGQACPEGSKGKKEAARHKNLCCCAITLSHETPDRCC